MRGRAASVIVLSDEERAFLEGQVRRHKTARSLSDRCRMVLLCAEGLNSKEVALRLGHGEHMVGKMASPVCRAPDRGADGRISLGATTDGFGRAGRRRRQANAQSHAEERHSLVDPFDSFANRSVAYDSAQDLDCLWPAATPIRDLQAFTDPLFVDKVRDIVGLYLSPPNRAIVSCVDEKSQIQVLDREQPVLPMAPGMAERRTHAHVRNGTTSLFAALDIVTGAVIGKCYRRHRATEFLDFLKQIDRQMPEGPEVHVVMDK